jgi:hypothetical protein
MIAAQRSITERIAYRFLQLALRFWPEESRHWGQALVAEFHEIERPFEALGWALGGLMLFIRASASHFLAWLKLPAGSRLRAASLPLGAEAPILPKRSRLFTTAVLLATCLLFFFPQTREAVSAVRAGWRGYEISSGERRTLEKLAARAEKEKDARTLAFVALTTPEPARGMVLADRAVALDPSLTWIYASRFYRPDSVPKPVEWLARLQASDPDNAFIRLIVADAIAHPRFEALAAHRTPAPQGIESALASDPRWLAQMDAALRAQRYDGYVRKHWDLICYAWNRDPSLSPSIVGYGLWSHQIPNLLNLKAFAKFEVHRAQQARTDGHPEQAAKILERIDSFGTRTLEQSQTDIERLVGLDLSRQATQELSTLYAATGREPAAQMALARVQTLQARQRSLQQPLVAEYLRQKSFRGPALLFQASSILLLLCGFAAALSYLLLELGRRSSSRRRANWQRILCRTADYAPASLLLISFIFILSFLPFARLFAYYRSASGSNNIYRELSYTLGTLTSVPALLQKFFDANLFWWLFTAALALLAVFLAWRSFHRSRPAEPSAL